MKQEIFNKKIGETIRSFRNLKRIKQVNIAKAVCINQCNFSKIENGNVNLGLKQFLDIAKELRTSPFILLSLIDYDSYYSNKGTPQPSLKELFKKYIEEQHPEDIISINDSLTTEIIKLLNKNLFLL